MSVKQMRDKRQVQLGIAGNEGVGGQESSTSNLVGVLQDLINRATLAEGSGFYRATDLFGPLVKIRSLQRGLGALIRLQLVQQNGVVFPVRNVLGKVSHPRRDISWVNERKKKSPELTSCATWQPSDGS